MQTFQRNLIYVDSGRDARDRFAQPTASQLGCFLSRTSGGRPDNRRQPSQANPERHIPALYQRIISRKPPQLLLRIFRRP
ncbi:hypothetical protein CPB85DRAFT_1322302 [Mucidula mucida]|nr:hypothetical protein CPB85DRAFT_1341078 [Mucidula mucida]KAF8901993.1 hypothetical protein CPB85DRAFT_1322302 [Mucidula mucida]